MPMPMTGSWAATRSRWRCPSPILPVRARRSGPRRRMRPRCADRGTRPEAGPGRVTAVDRPRSSSRPYAAASRSPGDRAPAEDLPFEGGCFDETLAELVINVIDDPVAGLREIGEVTRTAASSPHACGLHRRRPDRSDLRCRPSARSEVETGSVCPGSRIGHLADLFRAAAIGDTVDSAVAVDVEHATFEDSVEPVHARRRPVGCDVAASSRSAHRIARALPGEAAGATVRSLGEGLGGARRGLTPTRRRSRTFPHTGASDSPLA